MPVQPSEILSGTGIHSGTPCRLEIALRPQGEATVFAFPGFPEPLTAGALGRLPRAAHRATVLGPGAGQGNTGATVGTPEHLLAALLFFPGAAFSVRSDAAELPGLDGSAQPYRDALARLAPAAAAAPAWREYDCALAWRDEWADGFLAIEPAPRFSARYEWERGPLRQAFAIADAATAWREVLPARTFAFHREWRAALGQGLMAGAGRESGLLLAESEAEHAEVLALHPEWAGASFPLLNQSAFRVPDEPVKHKLLDLLGDLALLGLALPRAAIRVRNGGHAAHHRLLARLQAA